MDRPALRDIATATLVSGTGASLLSAGALAIAGKVKEDSALAPLNGPSQWVWGEDEARTRRIDASHTLLGYVIHHSSALLWAGVFETILARSERTPSPQRMLATAIGVTAFACAVDYGATPRRLRPGFRKHVGTAPLIGVYAAVALGMAAGALLWRHSRRSSSDIDLDL
jgi:hypothetical protein